MEEPMRKLLLPATVLFAVLTVAALPHKAQAAPSDYFDTVQKVYIGYYQRPADPIGLLYWAARLSGANGNLNEIIEAFANSTESRALYGTINSNNISNVVNGIYMALFNRPAEAGGMAYYINGFNSGQFTAATIMLNVLNGAQNQDLMSINNKLATANLFTGVIDPDLDGRNFRVTYAGEGDVINARSFLASVTWDPAAVPTQAETTAYMRSNIADPGDAINTTVTPPGVSLIGTYSLTGFEAVFSNGVTIKEDSSVITSWSGTMIIGPTTTQSIVVNGTPVAATGTVTITWITPGVAGVFHITDQTGTHDASFTISGNNLTTYGTDFQSGVPGITYDESDHWVKVSDSVVSAVQRSDNAEDQMPRRAWWIGEILDPLDSGN
jgi:hypothetical protein